MTLHLIFQSPFESAFWQECLQLVSPGSAILLLQNGVIAVQPNSKYTAELQSLLQNCTIYALQEDIEARGLQDSIIKGIQCIDYPSFVALTVKHEKIISWH